MMRSPAPGPEERELEDEARGVLADPPLALEPEPRGVDAPLRAGEVRVAMGPRVVDASVGPRGAAGRTDRTDDGGPQEIGRAHV